MNGDVPHRDGAELPLERREALELHLVAELDGAQVAEVLGVGLEVVETRLQEPMPPAVAERLEVGDGYDVEVPDLAARYGVDGEGA